jgi:hypothetical protein
MERRSIQIIIDTSATQQPQDSRNPTTSRQDAVHHSHLRHLPRRLRVSSPRPNDETLLLTLYSMAAGPPAGCRQTNVPHFGGICLCTKTAVITTQATITTTVCHPPITTPSGETNCLQPDPRRGDRHFHLHPPRPRVLPSLVLGGDSAQRPAMVLTCQRIGSWFRLRLD